MMETILFGAQAAKKFQNNRQKYQDDMIDKPNSNFERQAQDAEITSPVSCVGDGVN